MVPMHCTAVVLGRDPSGWSDDNILHCKKASDYGKRKGTSPIKQIGHPTSRTRAHSGKLRPRNGCATIPDKENPVDLRRQP